MSRAIPPLNGLRLFFEARWWLPDRIVIVFATAGAVLGVFSFAYAPFWVLLLPVTMAVTIRLVRRWGWLDRIDGNQTKRWPMLPAYLAPLSAFLIVPPFVLLGVMIFSLPILPFALAYWKMSGTHWSRHVDDMITNSAFCLTFVAGVALYCGLQARGLKRLTGRRYPGLQWQLLMWCSALVLAAFYFGGLISWSRTPGFPFEPVSAVIELWLVNIVLLCFAGRVFGLWLARSTNAPVPERAS